jgi:hypothetical protein
VIAPDAANLKPQGFDGPEVPITSEQRNFVTGFSEQAAEN